MKRSPKLALLAAVVVVALVASAAFAAVSATSNSGTSSSSAPSAAAGPNGAPPSGAQGGMPGDGRDQFAAALASKLGVSQAKVEAALRSLHQQLGSAQGPPSQDALTAALAKALGVDQSKVESALQSVRPPGRRRAATCRSRDRHPRDRPRRGRCFRRRANRPSLLAWGLVRDGPPHSRRGAGGRPA
jgi:hypothetical protein